MTNFLLILYFIVGQMQAGEWELKKDESDIKIYTRQFEGSTLDEFKAVMMIPNCTLKDVLNVILDVENYATLYADCSEPRILYQDGKWHDIHYFIIKAPWPLDNRDVIYEERVTLNDDGQQVRIALTPLPNYIEDEKGLTRIQKGTGFWELMSDNNGNIHITYQFQGEPGGEIPGWLANPFIVSHPFLTLQNLKLRVIRNELN